MDKGNCDECIHAMVRAEEEHEEDGHSEKPLCGTVRTMTDDEIRNPVKKETTAYPQDGITFTWPAADERPNWPVINYNTICEPDDTLQKILDTLTNIEKILKERLPVRVEVRELE